MNVVEWMEKVEAVVESLKSSTWEQAQENFLDFFLKQETDRMEYFNASDNVGRIREMADLFHRYQVSYAHERNAHFTVMDLKDAN